MCWCWTSRPTTWTSRRWNCWRICCRTIRGTLFLVSHDRAFLDNVVTQTIASEGDGRWKEYAGGYSDWQRARAAAGASSQAGRRTRVRSGSQESRTRPATGKAKLSYKEGRELAELPARVHALEQEQGEITPQTRRSCAIPPTAGTGEAMQARFAETRGPAHAGADALGGTGRQAVKGRTDLTAPDPRVWRARRKVSPMLQ